MKICAAILSIAFFQAQAPIKVDVRLVNVGFTVRDSGGKLVTGLSKEDFDVFDDGQPQPVSFFARGEDLPLVVGLLVDASGSQERFVKQHERDLTVFLENVLTARDQAFLLCFGNHLRLASDLSPSASDLIDGLKHFEKRMAALPEIGPRDYREWGTAFYDALFFGTTEKLAKVARGRRALIMFSDGEDNSSAHNMMDVIEAAQSEDTVIFAVRYTETRKGEWTARNRYGASVMSRISHDTGGSDFDAKEGDLVGSFREIGDQLRSTYELAYHSQGEADGTFHKIVIRCRKPGYVVRTKTGYFSR